MRSVKRLKEIVFYSDKEGILAIQCKYISKKGNMIIDEIQGTEDIEECMKETDEINREVWTNQDNDKVTSIYSNFTKNCVKSLKFTTLLHNVLSVGVDKFVDDWISENYDLYLNEEIIGMDVYFKRKFIIFFIFFFRGFY